MYRKLDATKIIETAEALSLRVTERFPDAGLSKISKEIITVARDAQGRATQIIKPNIALRILIFLLIIVGASAAVLAVRRVQLSVIAVTVSDFVQMLEAGINDIILFGAGIYFLVTIERRLKRRLALRALHELRSLAHVIDMHQLTKDPDRILSDREDTASSPKHAFTKFSLNRYLDYSSEMLSILSKIAALYAQHLDDAVVLSAVDEVESLTNGISRKIWQKIMITSSSA